MTDFLWPSDYDRAQSVDLDRLCEHLEQVIDERDTLQSTLTEVREDLTDIIKSGDVHDWLDGILDKTEVATPKGQVSH